MINNDIKYQWNGIVVTPNVTQYTVEIRNHAIIVPFQEKCQDISLKFNPNIEKQNIKKTFEPTKTTFSVISVIPCEQYNMTVVLKSKTGPGLLKLYRTIGPATKKQLKEYNYKPAPPTDTKYSQKRNILSWKPSTCATLYNVKVMINNTKNPLIKALNVSSPKKSVLLGDYIKPCTGYRYQIRSFYHNYSKFVIEDFTTGPNKDEIDDIKLNLDVKKKSVIVNICIPEDLSCVESFVLKNCQKKVPKNCRRQSFTYSSKISQTFSNLNDNTSYVISLTIKYKTEIFKTKEKEYMTKELIEHVNITKTDHDEIRITWTEVKPRPNPYKVYSQKITNKSFEKMRLINETKLNSIKLFQIPCQAIRYGISIEKGMHHKIKWSKEYTNDISQTFSAVNLKLEHSFSNKSVIIFTWQHLDMIKNYSIHFCKSGTNRSCLQRSVIPKLVNKVEFIAQLENCSEYTLKVIPTSICGKLGAPITKKVNTLWRSCGSSVNLVSMIVYS